MPSKQQIMTKVYVFLIALVGCVVSAPASPTEPIELLFPDQPEATFLGQVDRAAGWGGMVGAHLHKVATNAPAEDPEHVVAVTRALALAWKASGEPEVSDRRYPIARRLEVIAHLMRQHPHESYKPVLRDLFSTPVKSSMDHALIERAVLAYLVQPGMTDQDAMALVERSGSRVRAAAIKSLGIRKSGDDLRKLLTELKDIEFEDELTRQTIGQLRTKYEAQMALDRATNDVARLEILFGRGTYTAPFGGGAHSCEMRPRRSTPMHG